MSSSQQQQGKERAAEQYTQEYLPQPQQISLEKGAGKQSDLPVEQEDVYLPDEWNPKHKGGVTAYKAAGKLKGKHLLITGGDSGIGRATAVLCAMEGVSRMVLTYVPQREEEDAKETQKLVQNAGCSEVHLLAADLQGEKAVQEAAQQALKVLQGRVDVLFNNAAFQQEVPDVTNLGYSQIQHTFNVNILALMALTKEIVPHMPRGASIVNNASINAYVGHPKLLDYTATKGAIVAYTRALSNQIVASRSIRVNAVCPGPIWTPLPPATMEHSSLESFGTTTPMKRPGQPVEVATCVVFLAGPDSSYISGQSLHPNGGVVVNS